MTMTYRGHIENGRIMLDEATPLPEGAQVSIELVECDDAMPTIWEKLRSMAATVEGPEDWARNHDHYIHGTPKRA